MFKKILLSILISVCSFTGVLASYNATTFNQLNYAIPVPTYEQARSGSSLSLGSLVDPENFDLTAETFNATSTTFRFDKDATTVNQKRRGTTLTANLTAGVIRCPEKSGLIQVEFIQDGTGSRTIPTITAVKADGSTSVTIRNIGNAQFTATTTASRRDCIMYRYDADNAVLREVRRNLNLAG